MFYTQWLFETQTRTEMKPKAESIKSIWVESVPGHLWKKGSQPRKKLASGSKQLKDKVLGHQSHGDTNEQKRIAHEQKVRQSGGVTAGKASV